MNSTRLSTLWGASGRADVHKHVRSHCRHPFPRQSKISNTPGRDSTMLLHRNALRSLPHQAAKDLSSPLCHLRGEGGAGHRRQLKGTSMNQRLGHSEASSRMGTTRSSWNRRMQYRRMRPPCLPADSDGSRDLFSFRGFAQFDAYGGAGGEAYAQRATTTTKSSALLERLNTERRSAMLSHTQNHSSGWCAADPPHNVLEWLRHRRNQTP